MISSFTELRDRLALWTRHDLLLAGMPSLFLLTYLLGDEVFASHPTVIAVAAILTGALVVDGLFLHPPGDDAPESD